jgi:hypothetical protein
MTSWKRSQHIHTYIHTQTIASSSSEITTRKWLNNTVDFGPYNEFIVEEKPGALPALARSHGVGMLVLGLWEFFAPKYIGGDNEVSVCAFGMKAGCEEGVREVSYSWTFK